MKANRSFLFAALAFVSGCQRGGGTDDHEMRGWPSTSPTTTAWKRSDLNMQADLMLAKGQTMKDAATKMKPEEKIDGMTKDQMLKAAQKMIEDGNALKMKAMRGA